MAPHSPGLSLYVHVPFCTEKCLYCDFFSLPRRFVDARAMAEVVEQTIAQARFLLEAAGSGREIESIYVGGGTPSALPLDLLERLLAAFSGLGSGEWTVEANPETLDEEFISLCRRVGVTRLSVGIQTVDQRLLSLLGRRAAAEQAHAAIRLLRSAWPGALNVDFITGIPGQTVDDIRRDLSLVESGWPGHVSLYQLTLEQGTGLAARVAEGSVAMNPAERDEELWFFGRSELQRRGYRQYEISNFSLPGRECRHNLRYWRMEPSVGAGPAAVSTLPAAWIMPCLQARGTPAVHDPVVRLSNKRDIASFLQGLGESWGMQIESVTLREFLLENLMMGLRLEEGISREVFTGRFGMSLGDILPGLWEKWVNEGMAAAATDRFRLTQRGRDVLDSLLVEACDRIDRTTFTGLSVTWP